MCTQLREEMMINTYRQALAARLYRLANHAAAQGRYRQAAQTRKYAGDVLAGLLQAALDRDTEARR